MVRITQTFPNGDIYEECETEQTSFPAKMSGPTYTRDIFYIWTLNEQAKIVPAGGWLLIKAV